jgi:hypothetical protein
MADGRCGQVRRVRNAPSAVIKPTAMNTMFISAWRGEHTYESEPSGCSNGPQPVLGRLVEKL